MPQAVAEIGLGFEGYYVKAKARTYGETRQAEAQMFLTNKSIWAVILAIGLHSIKKVIAMHIEEILSLNEGKTLEFKENTLSLPSILKTVVAFANTAGGTIVLGVEDATKKIVGLSNPLKEEERLASAITQSITPFMVPDIEIRNYRDNAIMLVHVPHMAGPY